MIYLSYCVSTLEGLPIPDIPSQLRSASVYYCALLTSGERTLVCAPGTITVLTGHKQISFPRARSADHPSEIVVGLMEACDGEHEVINRFCGRYVVEGYDTWSWGLVDVACRLSFCSREHVARQFRRIDETVAPEAAFAWHHEPCYCVNLTDTADVLGDRYLHSCLSGRYQILVDDLIDPVAGSMAVGREEYPVTFTYCRPGLGTLSSESEDRQRDFVVGPAGVTYCKLGLGHSDVAWLCSNQPRQVRALVVYGVIVNEYQMAHT